MLDREFSDRWFRFAMREALNASSMSKDPNTQVGAQLFRGDVPIMKGWNGLPRGIADTPDRLADRAWKLRCLICAERNAILNCARAGVSTLGAEMFVVATDETEEIWGGPPCIRCTSEVIQAGIAHVWTLRPRARPSQWHADMPECLSWLREAGVRYTEIGQSVPPMKRSDLQSPIT